MTCETIYKEYETIVEPRPAPVGNGEPVTFVLRGLTDTEATDIIGMVGKDGDFAAMKASDRKSIYFALGGRTKLGDEGVKGKLLDMTMLENLRPEVCARLIAAVISLTYPKAQDVKN